MSDSLSVVVLCALMALAAFRVVVHGWLCDRTWRRVIKRYKETDHGQCPKCQSVHPEAVHHEGFHDFWTHFECPDCGYHITIHIDPKRIEDEM